MPDKDYGHSTRKQIKYNNGLSKTRVIIENTFSDYLMIEESSSVSQKMRRTGQLTAIFLVHRNSEGDGQSVFLVVHITGTMDDRHRIPRPMRRRPYRKQKIGLITNINP